MVGLCYLFIVPGSITIHEFLLFYAGIYFLAMFYWFIIFIYSKRSNYLALIAATASAVMYYLNAFGVILQYPKADLVFLAFVTLTFYLLASELNRFKKNLSSFTYYVFVVITVSTFIFQVLSPVFFSWQTAVTISLLLSVSGTISISCLFVYLWLAKRQQTARFAFFAYSPSMIGFIIFAFSEIKILPSELKILGPIGGIIFMLLLFYGTVTYVIALRKKRQKEHSEKEELIKQQNILLKQKVEERTRELEIERKRSEELSIKNENIFGDQLHHLEELLVHSDSSSDSRIGIRMADKIVFTNITDIMYCEAHGSYTNVCFIDGSKMVASKSLCDFELQLTGHKFFRIHNSSLINLDRVKEFQRHDGGYVIMENGKQLEVSQRRRKDFLDAIHDFVI